jgi:hypothetical protein
MDIGGSVERLAHLPVVYRDHAAVREGAHQYGADEGQKINTGKSLTSPSDARKITPDLPFGSGSKKKAGSLAAAGP